MRYDVVVIGGGVAGVTAAAAAAKCGSRTLLVESASFLGGVVTMGPLEALMTQYDSGRKVIGGMADELLDILKQQGATPGNVPDTTGYCSKIIPYHAESMKFAMLILLDRYHVDYLLETVLADAVVENGRIKTVTLQTCNGWLEISADAFVDCSGSGVLGRYAGCSIMTGNEDGVSQPVTVLSKWGNVDRGLLRTYVRDHMDEFRTFDEKLDLDAEYLHLWGFTRILKKGYESGRLSLRREEMHLMESVMPGEVIVNFSRLCEDPSDSFAMSRAQLEGSRQVMELFEYFRQEIPAFSHACIIQNSFVGVRESGRVKGRHVLTREDIVGDVEREDFVAMGAFPMDIHRQDSGMQYERILKGYGIPAAALRAQQVDNLFLGGRCVSSSFEANASARISVTCMATGHAAGVLAACYRDDISEKNLVKRAQETLCEQGAIIG